MKVIHHHVSDQSVCLVSSQETWDERIRRTVSTSSWKTWSQQRREDRKMDWNLILSRRTQSRRNLIDVWNQRKEDEVKRCLTFYCDGSHKNGAELKQRTQKDSGFTSFWQYNGRVGTEQKPGGGTFEIRLRNKKPSSWGSFIKTLHAF